MSKPPMETKPSVAGIVETESQRVIPASRRADGSIRKERKVKPGFTPAEDVTRFRSAGAERSKAAIPGAAPPPAPAPKAARLPRKPKEEEQVPDAWDDPPAPLSEEEKKARILRKKIKRIQTLASAQAEGVALEKTQVDKMGRLKKLEAQLDALNL